MSSVATQDMSSVKTEDMSSVKTEDMFSAATEDMSSVATEDVMWSSPLALVYGHPGVPFVFLFRRGRLKNNSFCPGVTFGCVPADGGTHCLIASRH